MAKMRKGVIFTVLTLFLALTVLTLAMYYSTLAQSPDISAEKTRTIFEDASGDLADILEVHSTISYDAGGASVIFEDVFPKENGTRLMGEYKAYVRDYASEWNAQASIDVGPSYFIIGPTDMVYYYPSYDKEEIGIFNASGDSMAEYDLYVFADRDFVNATEALEPGTMTVRLNATFPNGNKRATYALSRSKNSTIIINLAGASITISAGNNSIGGIERNGSIIVRRSGKVNPYVRTTIRFPSGHEIGVRSNVKLTLHDVIGRSDYLWLTPVTRAQADTTVATLPSTPTTTSTSSTTVPGPSTSTTSSSTTSTTMTSTSTTVPAPTTSTTTTITSTTTSSTTTTTSTSTTTSTTTTIPTTCNGYCVGIGHSSGSCQPTCKAPNVDSPNAYECTSPPKCCCIA